jgi:nucleoside-diphosphate-sugar epimerase
MRVLVTGHNGYIGSVMVEVLRSAGHDVFGLDCYFFMNSAPREKEGISAIRKDVRDIVPDDLVDLDAVVHLAALCNDPLGDLNPEWTFDINLVASRRLAALAKAAGVQRFLYASSCSMYGQAGEEMADENAPLRPLSAYATSKVRAEKDISKLADSSFSPVFLRNATAYGMSARLRCDLVLNNLICWAHTTGKVRIMSDGSPWRPLVHVEDISRAFAAALVAPQAAIHDQAFNVGVNEENYQVRDLAEIVRETVPGCEIEYASEGGPDPRSYRVNFAKLAHRLPGFKPVWDARRGARELYDGVRRAGMTLQDFQGPKYMRVAQFKYLLETGLLDSALRWKQTSQNHACSH